MEVLQIDDKDNSFVINEEICHFEDTKKSIELANDKIFDNNCIYDDIAAGISFKEKSIKDENQEVFSFENEKHTNASNEIFFVKQNKCFINENGNNGPLIEQIYQEIPHNLHSFSTSTK